MDDLSARISRGLGLYGVLSRALQVPRARWELEIGHVRRPVTLTVHDNGVLFEAGMPTLPDVSVARLFCDGEVLYSAPIERPVDYDGVFVWNFATEGMPARR